MRDSSAIPSSRLGLNYHEFLKRNKLGMEWLKTQGRGEKILVIPVIQGMLSVIKTHAVSEPSA